MKKIFALTLYLIFTVAPELNSQLVTLPTTGTIWALGQTNVPIQWTTEGKTCNVKIELIRFSNVVSTLTASTQNDGSFSWSKVSTGLATGVYRIGVTFSLSGYGTQYSEYFYIDPPAASQPSVTTGSTKNLAATSTNVTGTVNANGATTSWWFEYGQTTSYGKDTYHDITSGTTSETVMGYLSSLSPNTTYHYRLVATNPAGRTNGSDRTFTTTSSVPGLTTDAATNITASSARLKATVNPHGYSTSVYFNYGKTASYGSQTSPKSIVSGTSDQTVSYDLSFLDPGTEYHFQAVATSNGGSSTGMDQSFTTTASDLSVNITQPGSNVNIVQGQPVNISWTGGGTDAMAVGLRRDNDNIWENNTGEAWIASLLPLSGTYTWNTSDVEPGTYYIAAMIYSSSYQQYKYASFTVTIQQPVTTVSIILNNVDGNLPAFPGDEGRVRLFNSNGTQIGSEKNTENWQVVFTNVPAGSGYWYEVYHDPINPTTPFGREFWGKRTNLTVPITGVDEVFKRDQPYGGEIHIYNGTTEVTGQTVEAGTVLTVKYMLHNPADYAQSAKGNVLVDLDKEYSYDQDLWGSTLVPISANSYNEQSMTFTPTLAGPYFATGGVSISSSSTALYTDGGKWSESPTLIVAPSGTITTRVKYGSFPDISVKSGCLVLLQATFEWMYNNDPLTWFGLENQKIHFEIDYNDGQGWQNIEEDGITTTNTVADSKGIASNYFLAPDNLPSNATYQVRAVFDGTTEYKSTYYISTLIVQESETAEPKLIWPAAHSEDRIPILLVHGNGSDQDGSTNYRWNQLIEFLSKPENNFNNFDIYVWKHDTELPIGFNGTTGNAKELTYWLNNKVLKEHPNKKVIMVAHSRGGLVCRSYMNYEDQGNNVLGLITLGTPHHGSPFAVPDWSSIMWGRKIGSTSLSGSIYNIIVNTGIDLGPLLGSTTAFDYDRIGSLNLAWDNMDGTIIYSNDPFNFPSVKFSVNGKIYLSERDMNLSDTPDNTLIYSKKIISSFGSLANLNKNDTQLSKIITYGAYDEDLSNNPELSISSFLWASEPFSNSEHDKLECVTHLLAYSGEGISGNNTTFAANDGLVPIQSALFSDISNGTKFSTLISNSVSLESTIEEKKQVKSQRVLNESQYGIEDHLDLLDASIDNPLTLKYWNSLANDIKSFIQTEDKTPPVVLLKTTSKWYSNNGFIDVNFSDNDNLNNIWYQIDSNDDTNPANWHVLTIDGVNTLPGSQDNPGTSLTTDWKISDSEWNNLTVNASNGGRHYIYFKVTDDAGNVFITSDQASAFSLGKDVNSPSVYFIAPQENQIMGTVDVDVRWNASDVVAGLELSGIDKIYYALDQSSSFIECAASVASHLFTDLNPGQHIVYLKARDNAGNESALKSLSFSVQTAASIDIFSGNGQTAPVLTKLDNSFTAIVRDALGNGVEGVEVNFSITSIPSGAAGHSLTRTTGATDSYGKVKSTLTLGDKPGTYSVSASSVGLSGSPVTFNSTATEAPGLSVSSAAVSLSLDQGANASVNVYSNTSWTVTSSESWLTAEPLEGTGNGIVTVAVASANYASEPRTGIVIVTPQGSDPKTITVTQLGYGITITDAEGNVYPVIKIGDQLWMKENLRTTYYNNGDKIPNLTDPNEWNSSVTGSYCWYGNNSSAYGDAYGALYNWHAVSDSRNICPTGWHVPSISEWTQLENYMIANGYNYDGTTSGNKIAKALAFNSGWALSSVEGAVGNSDFPEKIDLSGFSALPGGNYSPAIGFDGIGYYGSWWSSTESDVSSAIHKDLYSDYVLLGGTNHQKEQGYSVRCIKDGNYSSEDLIAYYPFDGDADDNGGNGLNLILNGEPLLSADRFGNANSAYSFNGTTDFLYHDRSPLLLPATDFTINLWFKNDGVDGSQDILISTLDSPDVGGYQIDLSSNNSINFDLRGSNNVSTFVRVPYEAEYLHNWTMVTGVYTSSEIRLFVNGVLAGSVANSDQMTYSGTNNFRIGANPHDYDPRDRMFLGMIDDVRFYDRPLIESEILDLFNENGWIGYESIKDFDGNVYKTVKIGDQVWMAENLNTTRYNDGTFLPNITDGYNWASLTSGAYCDYDNNPGNSLIFGRLYNWYSVNTGKLCPSGWHVPTDGEWKTLELYLGMPQDQVDLEANHRGTIEGDMLKEQGNAHWAIPSAGNNSTGFTALPGGYRDVYGGNGGYFANLNNVGDFWTSTENGSSAWYHELFNDYSDIARHAYYKNNGYSVRCIQNIPSEPFRDEEYDLNDNKVPTGWEFFVTNDEVVLSDGRLNAIPVDAFGGLKRRGLMPEGIKQITFKWDGNLAYTYWGMLNMLKINYDQNKDFAVYLETAQVWSYTENYLMFQQNYSTGTTQELVKWPVPLRHGEFNYEVMITDNTIRFIVREKGSQHDYLNRTINIPEDIGFTLGLMDSYDLISYTTTDNSIWLDNIKVTLSTTVTPVETGTVTDTEGNNYKTVVIGNQTWMAENLKTTRYNDGETISGYLWYSNDQTYKDPYGALYDFNTVSSGKLCPAGWHVPSDVEWHNLALYIDPAAALSFNESSIAGGMLKESGFTHWNEPNTGASNSVGFNALPAGQYHMGFNEFGTYTYWWSSTPWYDYEGSKGWARNVANDRATLERNAHYQYIYFSVRCVKDEPGTDPPVITDFSPKSGSPGTLITILGSNLSTELSKCVVYFGSVKAEVVEANLNSAVVKVPVGAIYSPLSVTDLNTGLSSVSSKKFIPTFTSEHESGYSFAEPVVFTHSSHAYGTPRVTFADIDIDGKSDIVVNSYESNALSIRRNTSSPNSLSFEDEVSFPAGITPYSSETTDMDGDGKLDVAITNSNSHSISIFRNSAIPGIISSSSLTSHYEIPGFSAPIEPALADFDKDGRPDLAVANNSYGGGNWISVMRNLSNNESIQFGSPINFITGTTPGSISCADFDEDGFTDIITSNYFGNSLSILRNISTGKGIIIFAEKFDLETGPNPQVHDVGDLDGDGKTDIIVVSQSGNYFIVFRNTSIPGLLSFEASAPVGTGAGPFGIDISDADGDGKPDLSIACGPDKKISIFKNTSAPGSISFALSFDLQMEKPAGTVGFFDIDSDGRSDLVGLNYEGPEIFIFLNKTGIYASPPKAELSIGEITGVTQKQVCLPINAKDLSDITGFQFTLAYDPTKLTFINCSNWGGQTNVENVQISSLPESGQLTFVYSEPGSPVNIAEGKWFEINFVINEGASGSAEIEWSDIPTARELSNSVPQVISCTYSSGRIIIQPGYLLSGILTYNNAALTPINNSSISLVASPDIKLFTKSTDNSGAFNFTDLSSGTYVLKPEILKTWGGVTAMDLTLYKKHIGNLIVLDPLSAKSGDVNGSNSLTSIDLTIIKQRIGAQITSFITGDWACLNPSVIVEQYDLVKNIMVLCYGDANGSYTPSDLPKSSGSIFITGKGNITAFEAADNVFISDTSDRVAIQSEEFKLPIKMSSSVRKLASVTLTFTYPAEISELTDIKMSSNNEDLYFNVKDGLVTVVFSTLTPLDYNEGDALMTLTFRLKTDIPAHITEVRSFNLSGIGEFGDFNDNVLGNVKLLHSAVIIGESSEDEIRLYPNPANNTITVENGSDSKVSIMDITGTSILAKMFLKGSENVDVSYLTPGVYFMKIERNKQVIFKKFIKQ